MHKGIVIGGIVLLGAAATVATKYTITKLKRAAANIDFGISFNRIHGLVGDGVAKFLNPTIRLIVDLTLKNYSGIELEAENIYTRIEVKKPGEDWTTIATQQGYMKLKLANGTEKKVPIPVDVKGFSAISSITNRKNSHRAVVKYTFKGVELEFTKDLAIASAIGAYWDKMKSSIPSLKGVGSSKFELVA